MGKTLTPGHALPLSGDGEPTLHSIPAHHLVTHGVIGAISKGGQGAFWAVMAALLVFWGLALRNLDRYPPIHFDEATILESVQKTGRLVGVTEAYENTSFINEVLAQVNDLAFDWLDAPMVRVAAANVPVPRAEVLEDLMVPNVQRIVEACGKMNSLGSSRRNASIVCGSPLESAK